MVEKLRTLVKDSAWEAHKRRGSLAAQAKEKGVELIGFANDHEAIEWFQDLRAKYTKQEISWEEVKRELLSVQMYLNRGGAINNVLEQEGFLLGMIREQRGD